jgi:Tol biopolymer transport system component
MHRLTALALLLAITAAVSGCGGGHASLEQQTIEVSGVPSGPSAAGRIAYVSGNGTLWTVSADGRDPRLVARGGPNFPAWSLDGRRLAWECHAANDAGDSSLCVAASDGSGMRHWTSTAATMSLLRPGWSPDGGSIVLDGGSIAADGTIAQLQECDDPCSAGAMLVKDGRGHVVEPSGCDVDWPRFSPDGRRLAMVLVCGLSETLITVARDGSDRRDLATRADTNATLAEGSVTGGAPSPQGTGAGYFDHIDWSPDGRYVTFATGGRRGWDIHVARWDGTHDRRLTHDHHSYYPSFSPDGRMIVYQSWSGASWDIWTMRSDGAGAHAIVTGAPNDTKPTWCCRG